MIKKKFLFVFFGTVFCAALSFVLLPLYADAQTLTVTTTASPSSGSAPLGPVQATITVSGTATGLWNWSLNWNNGTNCFNPSGTSSANSVTPVATCTYNSPGLYNVSATVTRQGITRTDGFTVQVSSAGSPPIVDLKINGSDGPITVAPSASLAMSWTTSNSPTNCNATGSWGGGKSAVGGTQTITANSAPNTYTYGITCTNSFGSDSDSVSVTVNPSATPCTGTLNVSLLPSSTTSGTNVIVTGTGLNGCANKTISFHRNSPSGAFLNSCTVTSSGTGCNTNFTAFATSDNVYGKIDKNGDGSFAGLGEQDSAFLTISGVPETNCTNGVDDDGDGDTDCNDSDCPTCPFGTTCQPPPNNQCVATSAPFTIGSVSPTSATEGTANTFSAQVSVGGGASVISCGFWVDGANVASMNNQAGGNFGTNPCVSGATCTAEASYTFPTGSAGPHTAFVRCTNGSTTNNGATTNINVIAPGAGEAGLCSNGVDDDGDGATDCDDTECITDPFCASGAGCVGGAPDGICDAASGETTANCSDCGAPGGGGPGGGGPGGPGSGPTLPSVNVTFINPINATSFTDLVNRIIDFIFTIAVIVAPILLVIAGVIFMTAAGDPGRVATARRMLMWTIVGFGIILISKGLVEVLKAIIGLP